MEIQYKEEKEFTPGALEELFLSVGWESGNYPERLARAYQKQHIGAELMKRLLCHYEDLLYVKVMPSDPATIPFYEKFGFVRYDNYRALEIKRLG